MKYLLDTNICIYIIKKKPREVFARFRDHRVGDLGISAITYSELHYGIAHSARPDQNRLALEQFLAPLVIVPYSPEIAPHYGRIRAHLRGVGQPIGSLDLLIAAHAIQLGAVLVTNNVGEFVRVPRLKLENWTGDKR